MDIMVIVIEEQIMKLGTKEMMGVNIAGATKHGSLEEAVVSKEKNTLNKEDLQLMVQALMAKRIN